MTKKPASRATGETGSLAFDYANALIAQRLSGNNRGQAAQGSKSHDHPPGALRNNHSSGGKKKDSAR
ncbi:hypothetical protein [Burkholderia savannae]|uniref:hypothetical protein n=1 Tax=Burkholderia savannae TaxID=1637837 RepID=UPI000A84FBDA|nr:hypothetical protein [Burkholderia savannae]